MGVFDGWLDIVDGRIDRWVDGCMDGYMNGSIDGCL